MRHNHFGGNKVKKNLKIFLIVLAVLVLLAGSFVLLIMHDFDDEVVPVSAAAAESNNPYIVETGKTLLENNLEPFETIVPISARLISNKASFKFKAEKIEKIKKGLLGLTENEQ